MLPRGEGLPPHFAAMRHLLQMGNRRAATRLVAGERILEVGSLAHRDVKRDRVLHREFCARSDRVVRGMCRVAEQDDVAPMPRTTLHGAEPLPASAVANQTVALERPGEG